MFTSRFKAKEFIWVITKKQVQCNPLLRKHPLDKFTNQITPFRWNEFKAWIHKWKKFTGFIYKASLANWLAISFKTKWLWFQATLRLWTFFIEYLKSGCMIAYGEMYFIKVDV